MHTTRRALIRRSGLGAAGLLLPPTLVGGGHVRAQATPVVSPGTAPLPTADRVVIDLPGEPDSLDPALTYDANGWSVVHSVYDSLLDYGTDGQLRPLLAESFAQTDPLTFEVRLRPGVAFHNGEPLDSRAVAFSVNRLLDPALASQIAGNFAAIAAVEEVDPLTVRLRLGEPAPYLPAQIAAWLAILPPVYAADPANDVAANPVGTGPYVFGEWRRGQDLTLTANPNYFAGSPKGTPIARTVTYRVVPEPSTRVADLLSDGADLIRDVPFDQAGEVEDGGAAVIAAPVSGVAFIRIATDTPPFDDVRVRRALNHAVDVDAIVGALLGEGPRAAGLTVPTSLGHDPALAPYTYDPDRARALLEEAGQGGGFATTLELASTERRDAIEAIVAQFGEVGIDVQLETSERARFNERWADPTAPPLRFVTWRPLFDPYTLMNLVVSAEGFLSRHANPTAQPLLEAATVEPDPAARAARYGELNRVLRDEPAAVYLWQLSARYGAAADLPAWTPRPDEFVLPMARG